VENKVIQIGNQIYFLLFTSLHILSTPSESKWIGVTSYFTKHQAVRALDKYLVTDFIIKTV